MATPDEVFASDMYKIVAQGYKTVPSAWFSCVMEALGTALQQRDAARGQVTALERELTTMKTHKRMLEQDYDRDRKAMIEAERVNVVLNQQINGVIVEKIRVEQQRDALVGAASDYFKFSGTNKYGRIDADGHKYSACSVCGEAMSGSHAADCKAYQAEVKLCELIGL